MRANREQKERILIHLGAAQDQLGQVLQQLPKSVPKAACEHCGEAKYSDTDRANHRMNDNVGAAIDKVERWKQVIEGWRV
jgi:S-ribosylhomocysteine lyase LuxS involved in autoinducer biosynthesis